MYNIIVQCIGYCGVACFITSYLQKKRGNIILFSFIARIFFVTHYILLGGFSGAAQNAVGGIASAVSGKRDKKPFDSKLTPVLIVLLTVAVGILTYDKEKGIVCLLPVLAMVLQNIALWLRKGTLIRVFTLSGIPLWFVYNFISGSIPAMMSDTLSAISLVIAILRYDIIPAVRAAKNK